jgi:hypothetical protein
MNRSCLPVTRTLVREIGTSAVGIVLKSNQLRPSGARNLWREERRHGRCGDWRTSLSYPALLLKRKPLTLLIRLTTHFRQPRERNTGLKTQLTVTKPIWGTDLRR